MWCEVLFCDPLNASAFFRYWLRSPHPAWRRLSHAAAYSITSRSRRAPRSSDAVFRARGGCERPRRDAAIPVAQGPGTAIRLSPHTTSELLRNANAEDLIRSVLVE